MKIFKSIHALDDREQLVMTPYENHPGFYKDNLLHIAANREGVFYNTRTGKEIKSLIDKDGRCRLQFLLYTNKGYKHFNTRAHRVIGRIFVGRPKIHLDKNTSDLEINHINGIVIDNKPENLEWCTGKENTNHAFDNGLVESNQEIYSKNLTTDEVAYHRSIEQASFNLSLGPGLRRFIREKRYLKYRYDNYFFSTDNKHFLDKTFDALNPPQIDKECVVLDLTNGIKRIFCSIQDAANFINMSYKLLWYHLNSKTTYTWKTFKITKLEFL